MSSLTRQQFACGVLCHAQEGSRAGPALLHLHPSTLGEQMGREKPTNHCRETHFIKSPEYKHMHWWNSLNANDHSPVLQDTYTCLTSYIGLKHRCIDIRVKINRVLKQSGHALELCVVSQYLWSRRKNILCIWTTENHRMTPKNLVEWNFIPAMCPEHQWVWGKNLKEKGTNREVIMIEYDYWIMCSTMKDNILQTKAFAQFHWKKNCSKFSISILSQSIIECKREFYSDKVQWKEPNCCPF